MVLALMGGWMMEAWGSWVVPVVVWGRGSVGPVTCPSLVSGASLVTGGLNLLMLGCGMAGVMGWGVFLMLGWGRVMGLGMVLMLDWAMAGKVGSMVFLLLLLAWVLGLVMVTCLEAPGGFVVHSWALGLIVEGHNVIVTLGEVCHLHVVENHRLAAIVRAFWDQHIPLGLLGVFCLRWRTLVGVAEGVAHLGCVA